MKLRVCLLLLSACMMQAQAPSIDAGQGTRAADPKLHADTLRLIEVSGVKKQVQAKTMESYASAKKTMLEKCPNCTQAFADEWAKRMAERLKVDDLVAVYVANYEKYLTDDEVLELTSLQEASNAGHAGVPSEALKARLTSVFPSLQGDISAGCVQITTKLGAEIGGEIAAEHPEYITAPAKPAPPPS